MAVFVAVAACVGVTAGTGVDRAYAGHPYWQQCPACVGVGSVHTVIIEPQAALDDVKFRAIECFPAVFDGSGHPSNDTGYGKKLVLHDAAMTAMADDDYVQGKQVWLDTESEYSSKYSWQFIHVAGSEKNNLYKIVNVKTDMVLTVSGNRIVTQKYTGSDHQHFYAGAVKHNTYGDMLDTSTGADPVFVLRPQFDTTKSVFVDTENPWNKTSAGLIVKDMDDTKWESQWRGKYCGFWFAYDGNGATSGSMSASLFYMNYGENLKANAFARTGCTFDGWSTTRNGAKVYIDRARIFNTGQINRLHTTKLYARWLAPQTIKVYYQDKYGNYPSSPSEIVMNNENKLVGSTVSWSRGADTIYEAASVSYVVEGPTTKEVKVPRKKYSVNVIPDNNVYGTHAGNGGRVTGCTGAVNGTTQANGVNGDGTTGRWGKTTIYAESTVAVSNIGYKTGYHYVSMTGDVAQAPFEPNGLAVINSQSKISILSVIRNVTVSVNTAPNTYQVRYNGNGATSGSMSNSSHTYDAAKNLTKNAFGKTSTVNYDSNGGSKNPASQKPAWGFAGWATSGFGNVVYSDQQSVKNLTATNNAVVDIYAKWNPGSVTLPDPGTKTGYEFAGWYNGSECVGGIGDKVTVNVDTLNLKAGWTPVPYQVRYNGNGATSGSMSNSSHTYDAPEKLTKNAFGKTSTVNYDSNGGSKKPASQKPAWGFAGWATSGSGSVVYSDQQSVKNLTATKNAVVDLYAKWNPGSVTLADPGEKHGFSFAGWYNGSECVGGVGDTMTVTVDVVNLKAEWTPLWKVTYVVDGDPTWIKDADLITNPSSVTVPSARTEQARRGECHHINGTQGLDCWYTDSACTKKWVDGSKATGNITLYARNWATISYAHGESSREDVKYRERGNESNGGSIGSVSKLPAAFEQSWGKTAALSTSEPAVKIVKFDAGGEFPSTMRAGEGWHESRACDTAEFMSLTVRGDATVYKKWTQSVHDGVQTDR